MSRTPTQPAVLFPTHRPERADFHGAAGYWPRRLLPDLFAETTARQPHRDAIVDGDVRLSFAGLDRLVHNATRGLRAAGVRPGDVVAYQLPNWWEAVAVFLGALRAGAGVHALLPTFRQAELRFTLGQSRACLLVIPETYRGCDHVALVETLRPELPALRRVLVARGRSGDDDLRRVLETPPDGREEESIAIRPDAVALLMYTSGTTSEPKGVLHTHDTLAAEVFSLARVHDLSPTDRTLMPSPLAHISGVIHGILAPALLGTGAVLMDRWEPAQALQLIERERVTYMVGAPVFLQDLLAQPDAERAAASLRLFSCGGAPVSPALVARARATLPGCVTKRVYGSTEFPTMTTTDARDAARRGLDSEGRAVEPAEVRIVDAGGRCLPPGEEGEVQGRGPECFAGYLDAELNAAAFSADGWFRTGDLGTLDAEGYLRITGRLKEIVIRKGEKISIKEMEDAIAAHPAVAEVVVVACADADTGERACAVLRLRPGAAIDLAALTTFLAAAGVAKPKWPEELRVVNDFPRTASGKVLRRQLAEAVAASPDR